MDRKVTVILTVFAPHALACLTDIENTDTSRVPSRWRASGPLEVSSKSFWSVTFYTVLKKKMKLDAGARGLGGFYRGGIGNRSMMTPGGGFGAKSICDALIAQL